MLGTIILDEQFNKIVPKPINNLPEYDMKYVSAYIVNYSLVEWRSIGLPSFEQISGKIRNRYSPILDIAISGKYQNNDCHMMFNYRTRYLQRKIR